MPTQLPTLSGGGQGAILDSGYRFLAVSLKKCLSGDNYRRPSQLFLTRIVGLIFAKMKYESFWSKKNCRTSVKLKL